ncbi:hypothetical protein [Desulforamulus ferrireducens]|uniref:Uncharacterized protein n=1 Tax=Desulforamulus ferrireducens TaxID=1833852 RepID=A0A1S6IV04_9FIRM|nr:hypothetical protein [Desulforamulus ferrireducens]AQS58584.1 hypothetical protein B0537_05475 [Desulforamulus ferrireducens]
MIKFVSPKALERLLFTIIVLAAVFLLYYQTVLAGSTTARVTPRVGSDAEQVMVPITDQKATIVLQLVNFSTLPKARILVNGQYQGDFTHPYSTVAVSEGDTIEVDSTFYEHPVTIKVLDGSKAVISPSKGKEYSGQKTIITIGTVKLSGR